MPQWLKISVFCFLSIVCQANLANGKTELITREYPIPNHGLLILNVPEKWNVTYYEPGTRLSPIIIFYPQKKPYAFQLTISPLWDDSVERDVTKPDFIKQYIERVGSTVLAYSDEDQLNLIELSGRMGKGYYFQLSDSSAPAGEFRYLTQGALAVGEILLVFSYFSNNVEDKNRAIVIEMMQQAIQQHQRDVNFQYYQ